MRANWVMFVADNFPFCAGAVVVFGLVALLLLVQEDDDPWRGGR